MSAPLTTAGLDAGFAGSDIGQRLMSALGQGSPGQRRLAEFLLRQPIHAASVSIEELARLTGISAPTISRFARELGFAGFAELRTSLASALQAVADPVAKLRVELERREGKPVAGDMLAVIQNQVLRLSPEALAPRIDSVARSIARARTVSVMGFGLSAHVSAILTLGLQPFHPKLEAVVEYGGTEVAAGKLMGIGPEDLLIAITFPRYAQDVVNLTRYARDRGASVVALTDSPASPLVPMADEVLFAPAQHPALSSSMSAAVAVAETLVATVMLSDPANAERAAMLSEAIARYLHQD
jgi:DNA-binding MurR/RpiR family transcriptional regulator